MQETQEMGVQSLGWEDSPGGGNGTPLQYPCLENPMDSGGVWCLVGYSLEESGGLQSGGSQRVRHD